MRGVLTSDLALPNALAVWRAPNAPARLDARVMKSFLALKAGQANIGLQGWMVKSFAIGFLFFLVMGFGIILAALTGVIEGDRTIILPLLGGMAGLISLVFRGAMVIITGRTSYFLNANASKPELSQQSVDLNETASESLNTPEPVKILRKRKT